MTTSSAGSSPEPSPVFTAVAPTTALAALDSARDAVLGYQAAAESRLNAAQEQVLQSVKTVEAARAEVAVIARERDYWRDECARRQSALEQMQAALADQDKTNRNLREELLELYRDLRAEDLPTLILRIGMRLTNAENGLYVGPAGEQTIAAIGLDNLPDTITRALYEFTREVARTEDPVECNDTRKLPDGVALVNLAAVPVVLKNQLHGVMLVANKRSGPFTDDDTEVLLSIGRHAGVALENQRLHCALSDSYLSTIAVLADAIEAKDPYTRGHCESVAAVAVRVAQRMGFEGDALDQLRYAALLHDVGKIGIPDGILLKPGRLLPEEFLVIKRHSTIGSELVSRVSSLASIAPVILHHHEKFDGSGYPDGLSGDAILLGSRIVGVVDALDAMTTPRPYRDPVSMTDALEELQRCAGGHFDPTVVSVLAEVLVERGAV